jgi:hypothetical protein
MHVDGKGPFAVRCWRRKVRGKLCHDLCFFKRTKKKKKSVSIVRLLVEEVKANLENRVDGWSPFLLACNRGHFEVVKYLTQAGL